MTLVALVMVSVIIVTGAAVRLTGSGLGCSDWPTCEEGKLIQATNQHQAIEQVNRLFTGVMIVALAITVLGSLRRAPRRRDLTWLSVALVAGVFGQAIVGGIVVLTHLHPLAVQQHFVLSIVIVTAAVVLHRRAKEEGARTPTVSPEIRRHVLAVVVGTAAAIVAGTVVTGTNIHSGASDAGEPVRRLGFAITTVTRVHSVVVLTMLAVTLALAWRLRRRPAERAVLEDAMSLFLLAGCTQAALGYLQYALDTPALLVGFHIVGSVLGWIAAVHLVLVCRRAEVTIDTASTETFATV
jgi:cytochrome c oxidase assembly protein subunit 15